MESQFKANDYSFNYASQHALEVNEIDHGSKPLFGIGKRSFMVYYHNKYVMVPTESIAFFYIKYESTVIVTFDKQEFSVNYSLDKLQELLSEQQFFRLNRQFLINFEAIKEVEHYFARKLLVIPSIPFSQKLIVSKEKASSFFKWLENM